VEAFFAAASGGNFQALVAVLDPDAEMRVDLGPRAAGAGRRAGMPPRSPNRQPYYGWYEPGSQARVVTPTVFQALMAMIRLSSAATSSGRYCAATSA
jgi:hypothetical protein